MRKLRENRHNRVYHLISRIAHRAFYLDADERDRFIDVNPVKAKIVSCIEHASDYRWGSYHEACGGDADAIRGYDAIYGGHGLGWERLKELHLHSMRAYHKGLTLGHSNRKQVGEYYEYSK